MIPSWGKGSKYWASIRQVPERRTQEHTHHRLLPLRLGSHNVEKGTSVHVTGTSSQRKGFQTEWLLFFLPAPFPELKCPSHRLHLPCASLSLYIWPLRSVYVVEEQGESLSAGAIYFFFLIVSLPLFIKNITVWKLATGSPGSKIRCSLTLFF